jgi:predicted DCC family thiol-disulfide oxidoreductase YuxK
MGLLIYDGDCGFCRRCLDWGRRLGVEADAVAWQELDLAAHGLTERDAVEAAWFLAGRRRWRGHEAVARALRTSRHAAVRAAGVAVGSRLARPVAGPVYAWVARHRHRLPGGTPVCQPTDAP